MNEETSVNNQIHLYRHLKPPEILVLPWQAYLIAWGVKLCSSAAIVTLEYSDMISPVKGLSFRTGFAGFFGLRENESLVLGSLKISAFVAQIKLLAELFILLPSMCFTNVFSGSVGIGKKWDATRCETK